MVPLADEAVHALVAEGEGALRARLAAASAASAASAAAATTGETPAFTRGAGSRTDWLPSTQHPSTQQGGGSTQQGAGGASSAQGHRQPTAAVSPSAGGAPGAPSTPCWRTFSVALAKEAVLPPDSLCVLSLPPACCVPLAALGAVLGGNVAAVAAQAELRALQGGGHGEGGGARRLLAPVWQVQEGAPFRVRLRKGTALALHKEFL